MNLTVFVAGDDVFRNCECVQGFSFKLVAPRGKSAQLTAIFAQSQDRSVCPTVLNASRHIHTS